MPHTAGLWNMGPRFRGDDEQIWIHKIDFEELGMTAIAAWKSHPRHRRRLEIYNLIASHPPSADTGGREHISQRAGRGRRLRPRRESVDPSGRETIASHVLSEGHPWPRSRPASRIHRASPRGDRRRYRYRDIISTDPGAADPGRTRRRTQPRQRQRLSHPPHDRERWELVRTPEGWKFKHRTLRQLDGSGGAQDPAGCAAQAKRPLINAGA